MTNRSLPNLILLLAAAAAAPAAASGPFPETLRIQAAIGEEPRDIGGGLVESMDLVLSVFDPAGGPALYQELHCSVPVHGKDGEFEVQLGSVDPAGNPLDPALFQLGALELQVGTCGDADACSFDPPDAALCSGGEELERFALPVEAYALRAHSTDLAGDADRLDGLDSTDLWQRGDSFGGDVTGPGFDLRLADGAVTADKVNPAEIQRRVTGVCPPGSSIADIAEDGGVTCVADGLGVHGEQRFTLRGTVGPNNLLARDWTCPFGLNAVSGGAVRVPVAGETLFSTVGSNGPGDDADEWRTEILNLNPAPATYDFWVVCMQPE